MADMSWKDALALSAGGGTGGGSGVTSYDQLTDRPIQNVSGSPVVISKLPSGVYNVSGTWAITDDDKPKVTHKDDLFYVLNDDEGCKLTWITAGQIFTYSAPVSASASGIVEDRVTKESDCENCSGGGGSGEDVDADDLVGTFAESGTTGGNFDGLIGVF